jgi:hypothetical protein
MGIAQQATDRLNLSAIRHLRKPCEAEASGPYRLGATMPSQWAKLASCFVFRADSALAKEMSGFSTREM